jgi:hypothetical protein
LQAAKFLVVDVHGTLKKITTMVQRALKM